MQVLRLNVYYLSPADGGEPAIADRIPPRWYERAWLHAGAGISSGLALQLLIWRFWGYMPPSWLSFLAVLSYVAGFLFDVAATHRHVSQRRAFEERGLRMPTCEVNPLLPAYPTLAQQIFSITTLLSLLYISIVAMMPGVGFGAAILHGLAGLGNLRAYQRSVITLRVFDSHTQRAAGRVKKERASD